MHLYMSLVSLIICNQKYGKALSHEIAVKVLFLGTVALKTYVLFGLTVQN